MQKKRYSLQTLVYVGLGLLFATPGDAKEAKGTDNALRSSYTNLPFAHYEVILERMPFGRPPPPEPEKPAPPPEPEPTGPTREEVIFYKTHKLVALTRTDSGIGVGFIDSSQKPPKNYFALVGEVVDAYEIVSADFSNETVEIRKEGELYSLKLGQQTDGPPPQKEKPSGAASRVIPPSERPGSAQDTSYVERVRRRREALLRQKQQEAEKNRREIESRVERLTGEALQKHLREYNMELIRAGGEMGPPLPIELTPEEDAQLVEEGVLPPSE